MKYLKNILEEKSFCLKQLIDVMPHQVVSMSLSKSEHVFVTLFAYSSGESVSNEAYDGDVVYTCIEGCVHIVTEKEKIILQENENVAIAAGTLHAVEGEGDFKVLQIIVK